MSPLHWKRYILVIDYLILQFFLSHSILYDSLLLLVHLLDQHVLRVELWGLRQRALCTHISRRTGINATGRDMLGTVHLDYEFLGLEAGCLFQDVGHLALLLLVVKYVLQLKQIAVAAGNSLPL